MSLDTVEFPSGTVHTYIYIYSAWGINCCIQP